MLLDILTTGLQAIAAQAAAPSTKITLTRWELAGGVDFTFSPAMAVPNGTVFASGSHTKMVYVPMSSTEAMVQCKLSADDPTGVIGNLMLFASFDGDEYPFALMRQHEPTIVDRKLQTSVHKVGTDLVLSAMLSIPGLLDRFDFSNLTTEVPTWLVSATSFDLPLPFSDMHDQFFIADAGDARPEMVFNVGNQLFGTHIMRQVADGVEPNDPLTFTISGGQSGDGYQ